MPGPAHSGAVDSNTPTPGVSWAPVERYFQISLYLLLVAGFLTLAATGQLDVLSLLLAGSGLALRGWHVARGREIKIPERWMSWFTFAYVAFYLLDYFVLSARAPSPFVAATVHLVLFAIVIKIFAVHRDRDYVYLAVLAFLEVLAAAVLTVDTLFLAAFLVFLLLAVNTFISLELRRSARSAALCAAAGASGTLRPRRRPGIPPVERSLSAFAFVLVLGILLIGSIIFLILPRLTGGYLGAFSTQEALATGFSNEVNLGKIGEIQRLNNVVMYVQFSGARPRGPELKFRGVTLGLFNGRRWSNPPPELHTLRPFFGRFDLTRMYPEWNDVLPPRRRPAGRELRYRVLMEPTGANVFFLVPKPQEFSGSYAFVSADASGGIFNLDKGHLVNSYDATSLAPQRSAADLQAAGGPYPYTIELKYLQLPPHQDPRVRALAIQVSSGAATPFDKAVALESHLQTQYGYTLQLPSSMPDDPLADFLFKRKRGHCEYFASAMAIMLRDLGIPSRLVNGFRQGAYNSVTGSYVIRGRDAHSWVEAYFPGHGWVEFDPTPGGGADDSEGLLAYIDAGRELWREWIITYDYGKQRSLSVKVFTEGTVGALKIRRWLKASYGTLLTSARYAMQRVRTAPARWILILVITSSLLLLGLKGRQLWRAVVQLKAARHPETSPESSATVFYLRVLRILGRRGWRKLPAQTPAEFLATIDDPVLQPLMAAFTTHYERARFAGSPQDALQLPPLFQRIKSL